MRGRLIACALAVLAGACSPSSRTGASAQAVVDLPSDGNFGTVSVGQQATRPLTIQPASGLQDDTITAISASCPDFSVDAPGLPAHVGTSCVGDTGGQGYAGQDYGCGSLDTQTYTFQATFHPTVQGAVTCVVHLTISDVPREITLTGTGNAPPVVVDVTPTAIAFGDSQVLHASKPIALTVRNRGSGVMTVHGVELAGADFQLAGNLGAHTVASGARDGYTVICDPQSATPVNPLTGAVTVHTDDPTTPDIVVPLTCTGIDSAVIIDGPIDLDARRVGIVTTQDVAIHVNDGTTVTLEGASVTGDGLSIGSDVAGTVVTSGADAHVTLRYAPTAPTTDVAGTLAITFDGGQTRTTTVHASAVGVHMSVSPDGVVDLGPVCMNQTATTTISIMPNDRGSLAVTGLTMALGSDSEFAVSSASLPVVLRGDDRDGQVSLPFMVTATAKVAGRIGDTLHIATDNPAEPDGRDLKLIVNGLTGGVTTTPATLNFGTPMVGVPPAPLPLVLTNCSPASLTLEDASIVDDDNGDFEVAPPKAGTVIDPGASASYVVAMFPHRHGVQLASLVVAYDGGASTISLVGTATGGSDAPPDTTPTGESSYYACRAGGGGAAAWPIALALVIRRRRRR